MDANNCFLYCLTFVHIKVYFPHGIANFWAVNLRLQTKGLRFLLTSYKSFTSRHTATNHKLRQSDTEQLKVYKWFYRYREKKRFQNKQESLLISDKHMLQPPRTGVWHNSLPVQSILLELKF